MRLFSYVVARDYGFAPNPFHGYCTLATCKPEIRYAAQIGDWVVGTGSKTQGRADHIVFAMRVTETLTFNDYWTEPRFRCKRPNLFGSKKQAFGDNIYHIRFGSADWIQENSHHSYDDGTTNFRNLNADTKRDRVLISNDFAYWGGNGPEIPGEFTSSAVLDVRAHRGHKNKFSDQFILYFVRWIRTFDDRSYLGEPLDWRRSP